MDMQARDHPSTLIERLPATRSRPVLIHCDHAGRLVPDGLDLLGISEANLARHIGWDIGAAAVTRELSRLLGAEAILDHVSRLVIDPNRRPLSPASIPEVSDGCVIPGNTGITPAERNRRIERYFLPYHRALARRIGSFRKAGQVPALISVHSFTPHMNGEDRPWQIGIVWRGDERISRPLLEGLCNHPAGLVVGDNQPYSGLREFGFTVTFHAQRTRLPHVMIEIRQDEIDTTGKALAWASLLAGLLEPVLARSDLYRLHETDNPQTGGEATGWRHADRLSPLA